MGGGNVLINFGEIPMIFLGYIWRPKIEKIETNFFFLVCYTLPLNCLEIIENIKKYHIEEFWSNCSNGLGFTTFRAQKVSFNVRVQELQ